ncbi:ankyrin repeat protein [Stylonychia lemnae]|uniref:Ankyrin repeat protein n=1 Tax=Stylonychia lemnae TaxID=5949 RepID=A0A078A0M9_STYLE|nr:ankyrin repeat protein [Stylonychia lemnae]|eukprot:CDW74318.1 ankyrin repeat protein [Stylonychia lemnae]
MSSWTPIMMACRYGHLDVVKYLHEKGAQLERERGYCAIHAACYGGDYDTVKYLLETANVNPNPEQYERVPLFIAITINRQLIDLLLKNGAAYETAYKYDDKKTGSSIEKYVRYNDHLRKINDKFVLNLSRADDQSKQCLNQINIFKLQGIKAAQEKGKFVGIQKEDFEAILKYM